ncbi:MAG: glutaredoxin family protein [Candidatus Binatia bacterium]
MKAELQLYTRKDCCLCEAMKAILDQVAAKIPFTLQEIDVDVTMELQQQYGNDVPVLFVNGRKAFKHRWTAQELEKKLKRERVFPERSD